MREHKNNEYQIMDFHKSNNEKITFKRQLQQILNNFWISLLMNLVNTVLTIYLMIFFIITSYYTKDSKFNTYFWGCMNFFFHVYFLIVYVANIYVSKDIISFLKSVNNFIDFFSIIPYFILKMVVGDVLKEETGNFYIQLANCLIFMRIYSIQKLEVYLESDINKQLMKILLVISTLLLGFSGLLLIFERQDSNQSNKLSYHYMIYFVMTIVSTVGYENPLVSDHSKILLTILVISGIIIVPANCGQLMELLSSQSMYVRRRYKQIQNTHHIIIAGHISDTATSDFLTEFFHPDHGDQSRHCLILSPQRTDSNLEVLLNSNQYSRNVFYLQGDPLVEKDLKRCQAEKAKAIILLCKKQSGNPNQEDSKTILQAIVIKKFLKQYNARNVKICMQLLRPEGKTHYYLSLNKQSNTDQVICVEELKQSLLAKSCLCPGLMAFFTNLITSSGDVPKRQELEYEWLYEYWQGKGFEIYRANLSSWFTGKTFSSASSIIYEEFRAITFALEIGNEETSRIFTNPGQFVIPEHYRVTAYIIAEDKSIADLVSGYKLTDIDFIYRTRNNYFKGFFNRQQSVESSQEDEDLNNQQQSDSGLQQKIKNDILNFAGEWNKIEYNFHVTHNRIQLSDVTFKTMEKNILATNHIVLCGLVPNLINFILPLRAKNLSRYPPIVILHDKKPSEKQWNQIAYFPEIYYIRGNAMKEKDVLKTNIHKAQKVVILSPNIEEIKNSQNKKNYKEGYRNLTKDEEDLLDARTIFKYKSIIKIRPNIPIVTEMVCPQNLQFLQPNPKDYALMKKYSYALTPNFASGEIYLSSTIDTLICQSYYNQSLITILNHLLIGNVNNQQKNEDFNDIKISNLYHLAVPYSFYGQTFEKLFKYLIRKQNILSLGLYRLAGCRDNRFPYIVTNPDPQTILTDKDKVFILAQKMPSANSMEWGAPLEVRNNKYNSYMNNNETISDEYLNLDEKMDIENKKTKKLFEQSKVVNQRIKSLLSDIKHLKETSSHLIDELRQRENKIITKLQDELKTEIELLIPKSQNYFQHKIQMVTASSASSLISNQSCQQDSQQESHIS